MSVNIDGVTSDPAPVLSGIPRGTVLDPLLLLLYINDMPEVVSDGIFIRLFAVECLVYCPIQYTATRTRLPYSVTLPPSNTGLIGGVWGLNQRNVTLCIFTCQMKPWIYELCGEVLFSVTKAKYLGVLISNDLNWHEQVCKVAAKVNTSLHFIARDLKHCPRTVWQTAYCSLTRSGMEYCLSIWDPYIQKDEDCLEKVNRRAARVVFNKSWRDPNVSPSALLRQLRWQPMETRR